MNILLVEDERPLALAVAKLLKRAGYSVNWAHDGELGFREGKAGRYDAIILDVLLPRKNGWEVCSELRQARINTPILMLTSMDEIGDKVKGLNLGADDYLPKPFDTNELLARVNALLRRDNANKGDCIYVADLTVDRIRRRVSRGGAEIHLTKREYDLLEALAANEGRVLSREIIQSRVWSDEEAYSNTVDVFIGTLRKKVDAPFREKLIHTVVGFGYVLRSES